MQPHDVTLSQIHTPEEVVYCVAQQHYRVIRVHHAVAAAGAAAGTRAAAAAATSAAAAAAREAGALSSSPIMPRPAAPAPARASVLLLLLVCEEEGPGGEGWVAGKRQRQVREGLGDGQAASGAGVRRLPILQQLSKSGARANVVSTTAAQFGERSYPSYPCHLCLHIKAKQRPTQTCEPHPLPPPPPPPPPSSSPSSSSSSSPSSPAARRPAGAAPPPGTAAPAPPSALQATARRRACGPPVARTAGPGPDTPAGAAGGGGRGRGRDGGSGGRGRVRVRGAYENQIQSAVGYSRTTPGKPRGSTVHD